MTRGSHLKEAYEQEIGLKMLKMAILETLIFKILWGSMQPTPLDSSLAPTALMVPPLSFENPRSAPDQCWLFHNLPRHQTVEFRYIYKLKRAGDKMYPCGTPLLITTLLVHPTRVLTMLPGQSVQAHKLLRIFNSSTANFPNYRFFTHDPIK